jgi:hypothetical protein
MISRKSAAVLPIVLALGNVAVAGEPPLPRPPIGPRTLEMRGSDRELDMRPLMVPQPEPPRFSAPISLPVPDDRIRVFNIGNKQLHISYWDGQSAWQNVAVDAGQTTEVACSKCAGTVNVAFHNGKENVSAEAKVGNTYYLSWSGRTGTWIFSASAPQ